MNILGLLLPVIGLFAVSRMRSGPTESTTEPTTPESHGGAAPTPAPTPTLAPGGDWAPVTPDAKGLFHVPDGAMFAMTFPSASPGAPVMVRDLNAVAAKGAIPNLVQYAPGATNIPATWPPADLLGPQAYRAIGTVKNPDGIAFSSSDPKTLPSVWIWATVPAQPAQPTAKSYWKPVQHDAQGAFHLPDQAIFAVTFPSASPGAPVMVSDLNAAAQKGAVSHLLQFAPGATNIPPNWPADDLLGPQAYRAAAQVNNADGIALASSDPSTQPSVWIYTALPTQ